MSGANSTPPVLIRPLNPSDAHFILQLYNQQSFIRFIADKQIYDISDAEQYIKNGPVACRNEHGFALDLVSIPSTKGNIPIGVCGLLKRPELAYPDLGFALLDKFVGQGLAFVACQSILSNAANELGLTHIQAVVMPSNLRSIKLLEQLDFTLMSTIELYGTSNHLYQRS